VHAGSTNGTLINGREVKEHALREGDLVRIGATMLRYRLDDGGWVNVRARGSQVAQLVREDSPAARRQAEAREKARGRLPASARAPRSGRGGATR
jgi:hypothetical protein